MGEFEYCLMNRSDGSENGCGQCYVKRITPKQIERSAYLQEARRSGILPDFDDCNGFGCGYPTLRREYASLYNWAKRAMTHLQD